MLLLESGQSLLDVSLMLEGNLDDFYKNVMIPYNFTEATEDITNVIIEPIYNTDNNIVNNFLLEKIKIVTTEQNNFTEIVGGSFSPGYDLGYGV